jgi:hypothetical protein
VRFAFIGLGLNFAPEPTAAAPLAFCISGRFAAHALRRCSVSGGCGSAPRSAAP